MAAALEVALPTVNRWINGKADPDPRARRSIRSYIATLGPAYGDLVEQIDYLEGPPLVGKAKASRGRNAADQSADARGERGEQATSKLDVKGMEALLTAWAIRVVTELRASAAGTGLR